MARPLKVFTTFSGVGMQERGITNAGYNIDVVGTSETDIDAIVSYAAIHNNLTNELIESYDSYPSREDMTNWLVNNNIGYDWNHNKPYNWEKKLKSKKKDIEKVWLASKLNNNYGDICKIQTLPQCDLFTYSSPCTDLSCAGKQEGCKVTCNDCGFVFNPLSYDVEERETCPRCKSINITSTRSGLLAEVERILLQAVREDNAPTYLLQENVDALVGSRFMPDFQMWVKRLDRLGYNTYWTIMNTKYTGIPQNRNRLFALSIRKDKDNGKFEWPKKFDNGKRLKDVMQEEVPDKYYIINPKSRDLIDKLIMTGQVTAEDL